MKRTKLRLALGAFILISIMASFYGANKPLPAGISTESKVHTASTVEFVYDLTYQKDGGVVREQKIFERAFQLIDEAEQFIVVDMFLFNNEYDRRQSYPELAGRLTEKLIAKKKATPDTEIVFITDEINTFYGSYPSGFLEDMRANDIQVAVTDLTQIRDSNPVYSGAWRAFLQWLGSSGHGWVPNAFSPDSPDVTLRSYLKLLNFKANHRKVLITEKSALVTSANPHDASAYHSNIAFIVGGDIVGELLASEKAVAAFSGLKDFGPNYVRKVYSGNGTEAANFDSNKARVTLLTEGKIKDHLLQEFRKTSAGDQIRMGMFYLADRELVKELVAASNRGVKVRLVLDPNKDAFGIKKNGVPNRPVAAELVEKSKGAIKVRWYDTHGEQYHTKMTTIQKKDNSIIIGGSANLTERNLGNLNLETDLKIVVDNDSKLAREVAQCFDRIWSNQGGHYTVDFDQYKDESLNKLLLYRFQEWSGISSF